MVVYEAPVSSNTRIVTECFLPTVMFARGTVAVIAEQDLSSDSIGLSESFSKVSSDTMNSSPLDICLAGLERLGCLESECGSLGSSPLVICLVELERLDRLESKCGSLKSYFMSNLNSCGIERHEGCLDSSYS